MQQLKIKTHTEKGREIKIDKKQLYWFLSQIKSSPVSFHFKMIFTIITKDYNAQAHKQETFNTQAHKQETSNAQSQLKETPHNLT